MPNKNVDLGLTECLSLTKERTHARTHARTHSHALSLSHTRLQAQLPSPVRKSKILNEELRTRQLRSQVMPLLSCSQGYAGSSVTRWGRTSRALSSSSMSSAVAFSTALCLRRRSGLCGTLVGDRVPLLACLLPLLRRWRCPRSLLRPFCRWHLPS